jgi:hypothetical protein
MSVPERRAQRLRAALDILTAHPEGLPLRRLWPEVCR